MTRTWPPAAVGGAMEQVGLCQCWGGVEVRVQDGGQVMHPGSWGHGLNRERPQGLSPHFLNPLHEYGLSFVSIPQNVLAVSCRPLKCRLEH